MQFALENAKQSLINSLSAVKRNSKTLKCIKEALYLDKMPHLIEVYDNSHMQGSHAFGCYIAAEDGVLNKSYIGCLRFPLSREYEETIMQ